MEPTGMTPQKRASDDDNVNLRCKRRCVSYSGKFTYKAAPSKADLKHIQHQIIQLEELSGDYVSKVVKMREDIDGASARFWQIMIEREISDEDQTPSTQPIGEDFLTVVPEAPSLTTLLIRVGKVDATFKSIMGTISELEQSIGIDHKRKKKSAKAFEPRRTRSWCAQEKQDLTKYLGEAEEKKIMLRGKNQTSWQEDSSLADLKMGKEVV